MSFYNQPHPWNPGYVIPKYVMAEPLERGTFTTQWLPRGTISQLIPNYLARKEVAVPIATSRPPSPGQIAGRKLLGRRDAGISSLLGLGDSTLTGSSLAGSSLAGSTLAGSSLGETLWKLEPTGAEEAATAPPVKAPAAGNMRNIAIVGVALVAGYYLFGKKGRRR